MLAKSVLICDGCNVRKPFEHRCHEDRMRIQGESILGQCGCLDCHPSAEDLAAFRRELEG